MLAVAATAGVQAAIARNRVAADGAARRVDVQRADERAGVQEQQGAVRRHHFGGLRAVRAVLPVRRRQRILHGRHERLAADDAATQHREQADIGRAAVDDRNHDVLADACRRRAAAPRWSAPGCSCSSAGFTDTPALRAAGASSCPDTSIISAGSGRCDGDVLANRVRAGHAPQRRHCVLRHADRDRVHVVELLCDDAARRHGRGGDRRAGSGTLHDQRLVCALPDRAVAGCPR